MIDIFHYSFMVRAFAAGVVIAITAPLIGSFLVIRRLSLIADTLSHVALVGVAIGLLTRTQPLAATLVVTVLAALLIEQLRTSKKIPGEAVLALFLPGGLAISLVLMSIAHGFNTNLFSYLFGSITTVRPEEVWLILGLGVLTVGITARLQNQLLYASFDEDSARVAGINIKRINTILVVLTAITVSLSMRVVGILLIGALMVIPVVTAMYIGKSFLQSIGLSIAFALASVITGLFVSYYANLPAGAVIVLLALGLFGLVAAGKQKR